MTKKLNEEQKLKKLEKARRFNQEIQNKKDEKNRQGNESRLNANITINPLIKDEIEYINKGYSIIFTYYNSKMCEICKLQDKKTEFIINYLKQINKTHKPIQEINIFRDTIKRNEAKNDYLKLFENLPLDIEYLIELGSGGNNTERVYGYPMKAENNNYFCIITITLEHLKK